MGKQVRFTQLVKAAGRPHPATLWVADPTKDPEFKKAIDQNRIVTVHHVNVGSKKESGEIGFKKGGAASYLIFPKELPLAEGTRIIGLKFEMLDEPAVKNPVKIKEAKRKPKVEKARIVKFPAPEPEEEDSAKPPAAKKEEKKPEPKKETAIFTVTVEYKATAKREMEVEAATAAGAIEEALKEAKKDAPKAEWDIDASNVKRHS
jgi:hypothetical protein